MIEDDLPFNEVHPSEWQDILTCRNISDHKLRWYRSDYERILSRAPVDIRNYITTQLMKDERRRQRWEKRIRDLSRLLQQPPEIVFEVFSHLHPLDLYHLARTTKGLRSLIMTRNASWLWEVVFERNPAIPPCPPELSFPRWTHLLLGPMVCEKCMNHFGSLNMTIRHRLCETCTPRFQYTDIMTRLQTSPPKPHDITLPRVWSREDVQQVGIALGACEPVRGLAWALNASTDSRALKKLKRDIRTKEIAESIVTTRTIWNKLDEEVHASSRRDEEQKRTTTLFIVTRRLVKAGYSYDEVQRLYAKYPLYSFLDRVWINTKNPARYIRRNWPALRAKMEPYLIAIVEAAAATERRMVVAARRVFIQDIYDEFNITTTFPSSRGILHYDPFFTFINSSTSIPDPDPVEIMGQIRQFIDQWPPKTITGLVDILPAHNAHECRTDFTDLRLKFPSTVFTCTACSYDGCHLIGWAEIISHQLACTSSRPFQCRINDRGSEAALALLELIDLDPYTNELQNAPGVTHKEFVCSDCLDRGEPNAGEPLLWRECIEHFIDMDAVPGHLIPTWKIVAVR